MKTWHLLHLSDVMLNLDASLNGCRLFVELESETRSDEPRGASDDRNAVHFGIITITGPGPSRLHSCILLKVVPIL